VYRHASNFMQAGYRSHEHAHPREGLGRLNSGLFSVRSHRSCTERPHLKFSTRNHRDTKVCAGRPPAPWATRLGSSYWGLICRFGGYALSNEYPSCHGSTVLYTYCIVLLNDHQLDVALHQFLPTQYLHNVA